MGSGNDDDEMPTLEEAEAELRAMGVDPVEIGYWGLIVVAVAKHTGHVLSGEKQKPLVAELRNLAKKIRAEAYEAAEQRCRSVAASSADPSWLPPWTVEEGRDAGTFDVISAYVQRTAGKTTKDVIATVYYVDGADARETAEHIASTLNEREWQRRIASATSKEKP